VEEGEGERGKREEERGRERKREEAFVVKTKKV
jgi:hypothetical protein